MRLIDADALMKRFEEMQTACKSVAEVLFFDGVMAMVENAPTIDAVPVVRCKDCVYRNIPNCCPYQINGFKITHDWYCPMGVTEVQHD